MTSFVIQRVRGTPMSEREDNRTCGPRAARQYETAAARFSGYNQASRPCPPPPKSAPAKPSINSCWSSPHDLLSPQPPPLASRRQSYFSHLEALCQSRSRRLLARPFPCLRYSIYVSLCNVLGVGQRLDQGGEFEDFDVVGAAGPVVAPANDHVAAVNRVAVVAEVLASNSNST